MPRTLVALSADGYRARNPPGREPAWATIFRATTDLRRVTVLAIAYYLAGRLGLWLAIPPGYVTAVWPPSGVALAGLVLWGYRMWPGVLLGSFLVNVGVSWEPASLTSVFRPLTIAASIGAGSALQALLGAFLIRRWISPTRTFDRARDVFRFTGIELLSCLVAATWGVTTLCLAGLTGWASYSATWWTWWMGDLIGVLIVTPLLLTWSPFPRFTWHSWRVVEAILSVGLALVITQNVFTDGLLTVGAIHSPLVFVLMPCVVWLAFRFDQRVVTLATLLMSVVALYGVTQNLDTSVTTAVNDSLLWLQSFLGIASVTGLTLTVALSEHKRAEEQFRRVVESAPNAIVVVNRKGRIVLVNSQTETLFGYVRSELLGQPVELLIPDRFRAQHPTFLSKFFAQPETRAMGVGRDLHGRRKDASEFPVEIGLNPIETEDGMLVLAAIVDITRRKRDENELYQAHAELEQRVSERTIALARTNQALLVEVAERKQAEANRQQLLRRLVSAQEDERRRLARELHDQMGQSLTALLLNLQGMKDSLLADESARARLQQLLVLTDQMGRRVHGMAWELRPTALDDLGLHTTLLQYFEDWSARSQVTVDFHCTGLEGQRLPAQLETGLYRILLETLTNVAKHAHAQHVSLILECGPQQVSVIVEDDGCGIGEHQTLQVLNGQRSLGLLGMRERVALLGGTFQIESAPDHGTTLFIRIPLSANIEEQSLVE